MSIFLPVANSARCSRGRKNKAVNSAAPGNFLSGMRRYPARATTLDYCAHENYV